MNKLNLWKKNILKLTQAGVYNSNQEHESCGVGLVAAIDGQPRRSVVEAGIKALKSVWHRGAVDADGKTGDGAGLQVSYPQEFFKDYIRSLGINPSKKNIAIGMLFLPRNFLRLYLWLDNSSQFRCLSYIPSREYFQVHPY